MVRPTLRTTVVTCSAFAALTIVTACSAADGAETATTATASTVSDDATTSTSTAGTSTTSQAIVASTAVDSSPTPAIPDSLNWSANLIGGGSIDLATYAGQDVLLWFWAPY